MQSFAKLFFSVAILFAVTCPAGATSKPYTTRVACSLKKSAPASHACRSTDKKGAFFRSNDADATYTICVKFPTGKKLCAPAQESPRGTLYMNKISSKILGQHVVTWFVDNVRVGKFTFRVT